MVLKVDGLGVDIYFFNSSIESHHIVLAPEDGRAHRIGGQRNVLSVELLDREIELRNMGKFIAAGNVSICINLIRKIDFL